MVRLGGLIRPRDRQPPAVSTGHRDRHLRL